MLGIVLERPKILEEISTNTSLLPGCFIYRAHHLEGDLPSSEKVMNETTCTLPPLGPQTHTYIHTNAASSLRWLLGPFRQRNSSSLWCFCVLCSRLEFGFLAVAFESTWVAMMMMIRKGEWGGGEIYAENRPEYRPGKDGMGDDAVSENVQARTLSAP